MNGDISEVIVGVLAILVGGGGGGVYGQWRAEKKAKAKAAREQADEEPRHKVEVTDLVRKLANEAVADADDRLERMRHDLDAMDRRLSAAEGRADDAQALAELLARKYAQAETHIVAQEVLLREAGVAVPPWPPNPDDQGPVISHDRRSGSRPIDFADRRRNRQGDT